MIVFKWLIFLLGWCATALGLTFIVLPGLPGVPILIFVALPCFLYSSPRAHAWLINNRWCGKDIQDWKQHGVISRRAKIRALGMIGIGMICVMIWVPTSILKWVVLSLILLGAVFVATRPSAAELRSGDQG